MDRNDLKRLISKAAWHDGCLVWIGTFQRTGYGLFHFMGKNRSAHRVSFLLHKGEIPHGMLVMHTCDNRACINPEHLVLGTHRDNARDMVHKNRGNHVCGEQHPLRKLTAAEVVEIRTRYIPYDKKHNARALAREFGVTSGTVWAVLNNRTWINSPGDKS